MQVKRIHETDVSLQTFRHKTLNVVRDAYSAEKPVLVDALPGMGKSYAAVKAAAQTGEPITILTTRGRDEQYEQIGDWCRQFGLTHETLPSALEDCPTLAGEYESECLEQVKKSYDRGARAADLHNHLDMPCNPSCPYIAAWESGWSADVLIGHYHHAHVESVLQDRVVVFDEFPGEAYLNTVNGTPAAITRFLQDNDSIPFDDHTDLIEHRDTENLRQEARSWFAGRGLDLHDGEAVINDPSGQKRPLASLCALTLLELEDLGNGWESAVVGGGQVGVYNRASNKVTLLIPPTLSSAANVVGLDGTPTVRMWDMALGCSLTHQQVHNNQRRKKYIEQAQGLDVVQTTRNVYPYSSGNSVKAQRDAALIWEVAEEHGETPGVISSKDALSELKDTGVEVASSSRNYGNVKGSNELSDLDVGVVLGSPHYGDDYVARWSALAGVEVQWSDSRDLGEDYGGFGDHVRQHMREHEVAQAIFRFARQGNEATVYVNTSSIPDWFPISAKANRKAVTCWDDKEREIREALAELGNARVSEVAEMTGTSKRYVREVLNDAVDRGSASKRTDPDDGRGGAKRYYDESIADANPFGPVELPPESFGTTPNNPLLGIAPKKPEASRMTPEQQKEAYQKAYRWERRKQKQVNMELFRRSD